MILGTGTDIIELEKIRQYSKQKSFLNKVFTKQEIEYAKQKKDVISHLATTFAAKEAVFKAFGMGWIDGKEIEIVRSRDGKPMVILYGHLKKLLKKKEIMISLSYTDNYAVAFAIIFS